MNIVLISIIILFFIKLQWGVTLYLLFLILVPYDIKIGGLNSSFILPVLLICAAIIDFFRQKKNKYDFRPFTPFILLYFLLILETIFQFETPTEWEFNAWKGTVASTLILPIIMWNLAKNDYKCSILFRNVIISSTIIIIIYALFLTKLNGDNPYVLYMSLESGIELKESQFGEQSSRLLTKISSIFPHPMTFGLYISLIIIYISVLRNKISNWLIYLILIGLSICIFISGIRTPIATLFVTALSFLIITKRFKTLTIILIVLFISYSALSQIFPAIFGTIESIFESENSSKVSGSSLTMRIEQLKGCFQELSSNPLFGKGYNWNIYYLSEHSSHPTILNFESLIYIILCNFGIIGVFIWFGSIKKLFTTIKKMHILHNTYLHIIILIISYLTYTIITGDYGYMKYFVLIYTLILIENSNQQKNTTNESKNYSTLFTTISSNS